MLELRRIEDNITQLKVNNKHNKFLIEQFKFIGAVPVKESSEYITHDLSYFPRGNNGQAIFGFKEENIC